MFRRFIARWLFFSWANVTRNKLDMHIKLSYEITYADRQNKQIFKIKVDSIGLLRSAWEICCLLLCLWDLNRKRGRQNLQPPSFLTSKVMVIGGLFPLSYCFPWRNFAVSRLTPLFIFCVWLVPNQTIARHSVLRFLKIRLCPIESVRDLLTA